ncbi:TetR/AcrR family transcriptional regulator [Actinomadura craniellae]|uniref:TetR/AcrR family transcriptional regulator n=1 Tax=Actinomadura craniellae TaxID=2231787 RepID=A0A365H822_9ACTN|nr:TetR family transcriptional regulator [Actinomadura craniellae]RAY15237.1 TetR/AcrR family transcriptional regulator [Actinomadura craniellae]
MQVHERPRRDRAATRRRLLDTARALFAEHGYDHVSVRMIAGAAGANVALINRYFGTKAALFGEVLAEETELRRIIEEGDRAGLPRRLAERFVRQIESGQLNLTSRLLDRSIGSEEVQPILRQHIETVLAEPLTARLAEDGGDDARARAALAATIILGGGSVRRMIGLAELRALGPAVLLERLTAMYEAALAPVPAEAVRRAE